MVLMILRYLNSMICLALITSELYNYSCCKYKYNIMTVRNQTVGLLVYLVYPHPEAVYLNKPTKCNNNSMDTSIFHNN